MINSSKNKKDSVLIVDDCTDTLSMLSQVLEKESMQTLIALEGAQALSIAQQMIPDIILLDAVMPKMSGFDVCKELKKDPQLKYIPVIFMTGLSDSDSVVQGFNAGGIDYITKPIVNSELIARMRVHLISNRLTQSAQSALDIAGQYVFAVNRMGGIVWSTSHVNEVLETASHDNDWLSAKLNQELRQWLSMSPSNGMSLRLKAPNSFLRVLFLGESNTQEYLLKLVDTAVPNESLLLQNSLNLTAREAEVLLWIAKGKTNRDIGEILGTSPRTINKHSENIYKKLGVENRTSAAAKVRDYIDQLDVKT